MINCPLVQIKRNNLHFDHKTLFIGRLVTNRYLDILTEAWLVIIRVTTKPHCQH